MGPLFQWVRASQKVQWPVSIKVRLPTNPALKVLAIVDVDGSGRLSAGDYLSKPLSVAEATRDGESTAVFPLVRVVSATSDTPSLEVEEGVAYGAVALTVDVAKELVGSKPSGRIIVSGSRSGPEGQASEKPSFYWASNQVHSKWPARLDVQMPAQLDVRVLLDQNGDHGPDPGDLTGAVLSMFSPPPSGQLEFKLDRPYSIADEVEADEGVTYGAVDLTVELASALLGSKPAGRIVVLGTPAGPEGQDSEKPPFYWASKEIYSEWPVSLEAQMPSGLDVRVLLDQNGGRGPDGGDLTGAVLPMFSPPKSGQLEFKLDRPYSVTEDTNFNEEPFPGSGGCGWFSD